MHLLSFFFVNLWIPLQRIAQSGNTSDKDLHNVFVGLVLIFYDELPVISSLSIFMSLFSVATVIKYLLRSFERMRRLVFLEGFSVWSLWFLVLDCVLSRPLARKNLLQGPHRRSSLLHAMTKSMTKREREKAWVTIFYQGHTRNDLIIVVVVLSLNPL